MLFKKMLAAFAVIAMLTTNFSCAENEFSSSGNKKEDTSKKEESTSGAENLGSDGVGIDGNLIDITAGDESKGKLDQPAIIGKAGKGLNISLDPVRRIVSTGSTDQMPIDVYFVLDVTGSMQINITSIRNNIQKFASRMVDKKYDARFALVPFRDSVLPIVSPTSDAMDFAEKVGMQDADGGKDPNEAALAGLKKAIETIKDTKSPEAYAAVVVITDNPGHMGVSTTNCDISPIVDILNNLDEGLQEKVKIYASVESSSAVGCSGYSTPRDQFQEIVDRSLDRVPYLQRGKIDLTYPFEEAAIIEELIPAISKTIPNKELVCLPSEAKISSQGTEISNWKNGDLGESYKRYINSTKVFWTDVIKDGELEKYDGKTLDLLIKRCCVTQYKAAAGNFSCTENEQKVSFEVKDPTKA